MSHKVKAEDRLRTEAEDAPSVHPGNSSSNQDHRSSHSRHRCSPEDEVKVDGREEVDEVHSATSVGAGATFGNSALCWFVHQDEGATRLQEVEADSLVAVAKLDEDNPLACRRWQARMCPSWVSTHWHILRRNPISRETRRAQPAPRYCAWAKTETDVSLPGGRWYITRKTQEKEEKDQVYGIQSVQYSLVYIHSTSTVYMSTVYISSRESCYNARGVIFS